MLDADVNNEDADVAVDFDDVIAVVVLAADGEVLDGALNSAD